MIQNEGKRIKKSREYVFFIIDYIIAKCNGICCEIGVKRVWICYLFKNILPLNLDQYRCRAQQGSGITTSIGAS